VAFLKADNSVDPDSVVTAEFPDTDDVWLTLSVKFSAAALAVWTTDPTAAASFSGNFYDIWTRDGPMSTHTSGGLSIDAAGPGNEWIFIGSWTDASTTPAPVTDTYQLLELHWVRNGTSTAYVDGTAVASGTAPDEPATGINVGQRAETPQDASAFVFIDNVKVGTSRGADDLFSDGFEDGTFDAWVSTTGTVSILGAITEGSGSSDDNNTQISVSPGVPILWTVKFWNQDGSSDPNSKYLVNEVYPENLHFVKNTGNLGPHLVDFELSLTARDTDGDIAVSSAFIGPYRTDFELLRSDLTRPVINGVITNYGDAQAGENHVKISGKSYLHWLETRGWPYDASLSYVNWPSGFRFKVAAADIGQIVKDILETVRDLSPNFPSGPGSTLATRSFSLDFIVDVDEVGKNINFEIDRFDPQTLYDIVTGLGQGADDDGGFEFIMTVDKVFRLAAPSFGDPDSPVLELAVDVDTNLPNMTAVSQTNTGPEATHVLGVGAGTSNRQGGVNKHFRKNSSIFRRIDKVSDFGDVKNLDALETLTSSALSFSAYPVHEVPVEVNPNEIDGFWTKVWPGKYANVVYDLGYAQIPNEDGQPMKIVSMDCTVSLEGQETVTLGLNQKHNTSDFAGLADW
jgi:hypothetical protein